MGVSVWDAHVQQRSGAVFFSVDTGVRGHGARAGGQCLGAKAASSSFAIDHCAKLLGACNYIIMCVCVCAHAIVCDNCDCVCVCACDCV